MLKLFVNSSLIFSGLGFLFYLFLIVSSFFSCCIGLDNLIFHKFITVGATLVTCFFGWCMYRNCYKQLK